MPNVLRRDSSIRTSDPPTLRLLPRRTRTLPSSLRGELECLEQRALLTVTLLNSYTGMDVNAATSGGFIFTPPDTCGAAGPTSYVETANQALRIYNPKQTGASSVTSSMDNFWFTQGGLARPSNNSNLSDATIVFDDLAQRFIVGDQDIDTTQHVSTFDIAVSKSASPATLTTADWFFYQINTTESGHNADYPGNMGFNHDAFVFTLNQVAAAPHTSTHGEVIAVAISDLVAGNPITPVQTDISTVSLRPTTMHDSIAGDPMWLIAEGSGSAIKVVKMTNVLSGSPTFSTTNLSVNAYSTVVPPLQPDGSQITTNIDSRIQKAAEFNKRIVACQAISTSATQDVARWYAIDVTGATPTIHDQGNVSAGNNNYIVYPSIDISSTGNIGMTFLQSGTGAGQYMSMYVTGRNAGDPTGVMQTPSLVHAGVANETGGREGDLSGINVDADGTFWAVNEWAASTSVSSFANWSTAIGHFTIGQAPVVNLNSPSAGYTTLWSTSIGAVNVASPTNATITDSSAANLTSMTLALASTHTGDVLAANTSGTSITASFAGGVLTLSGSDTVAHYQQVLRTATYDNTAGGPGIPSVTVQVLATDTNALTSTEVDATINIDSAAPVVDLNNPSTGFSTLWSTATGAVNIANGASGTITDFDSANLSGLTATLATPHPGDVLAANTSGTGITANYASGVLALTGSDTVLHYQQVLRTITYNNTSGGPIADSVTVNVVASDDGLLDSNTAVATINIDSAAPVLELAPPNTDSTANWTQPSGPAVALAPGGTLVDSDSASLASLTATLTSPQTGDVLSADTTGTSIVGSFSAGVLTLSGSDTVFHYQQVLQSITYNNTAGGPGVAAETVNLVATDDGLLASNTTVATINIVFSSSSVVDQFLFYKGSSRFDVTNNNLPGFSDDNAIAPDKTAYLPGGGTATFSAVSNYTRGINGLMVDLAGGHGTLTANDFIFKVGNNNSPSLWATADAPTLVTTRSGAGTGGSDRVELMWADNAIQKQWLEVIVKGNDTLGGSNTNTGLASSYVFYFGNALGDSGAGDTTTFLVNSTDEISARNDPHSTFSNPAAITNVNDFNRDGNVNSTDQITARNNATSAFTTALKFLTVGAGGPFAPALGPDAAAPLSANTTANDSSLVHDSTGDQGIASAIALGPKVTKSSPGAPFALETPITSAVAAGNISAPTTSDFDQAANLLSLDRDLVPDPADIDAELLELLVGLGEYSV